MKTCSNQNKRIICRRCLPCRLYRRRCLPCRLYRIIRQDFLQFYLLFIYQQAICARRNIQFNSCVCQGFKSWGLGLLHALRYMVLGCSIHYCSHVKATSYSIAIKTEHWHTTLVPPYQRIICWAFKEEKGVGERRINCSLIPKYNEMQQKFLHTLSSSLLLN